MNTTTRERQRFSRTNCWPNTKTMVLDHLDDATRELMLAELERDIEHDAVYVSRRLSPRGQRDYLHLLRFAFAFGTPQMLAHDLDLEERLLRFETFRRKGETHSRSVPENAAANLAEGEFNRYYMRALALRVLRDSTNGLIVCRVKSVRSPRPESERRIGSPVDAEALLTALRQVPGNETAEAPDFGWLRQPNSGLGVCIVPVTPPLRELHVIQGEDDAAASITIFAEGPVRITVGRPDDDGAVPIEIQRAA